MIRRLAFQIRVLVVALLAVLPVCSIAVAQVIELEPITPAPDSGSQVLPVLPAQRGHDVPSVPEAAPATAELLAPLRPLQMNAAVDGVARLRGEEDVIRFSLLVPEEATRQPALFRLLYRTGIDALPERSFIQVSLNGTDIARISADSFDSFAAEEIELPAGLLVAGQNIVTVHAVHTHRVFCGPEATFALWSEVDIRRSGVVLPSSGFPTSSEGFLAALAAQAALGRSVTVSSQEGGPESLRPLSDVFGQIVRFLGGLPPVFDAQSYWRIAEQPELARIVILPETAPARQGPQFVRGGDGAVVLLLDRGATSADLLAEFDTGSVSPTASHSPAVVPGQPAALGALGWDGIDLSGRYALRAVPFRLPEDWLLLASQKARIDLDYSFAPDVPQGALLVVKVNDQAVRLLPLDRGDGSALPTLPVKFEARLLRPGENRIAFETIIPSSRPDSACPEHEGPFAQIAATTVLNVPESPRMLLPSIASAFANIGPDDVQLSESGERLLPAALSPLIKGAFAQQPQDSPPARLMIGTVADIELLLGSPLSEAAPLLEQALLGRAQGEAAGQEGAPAQPTPRDVQWIRLPDVSGALDRVRAQLAGLAGLDAPTAAAWLQGKSAEAVILQPDPADPDKILFLMRPSLEPVRAAVALSHVLQGASAARGQIALLTPEGEWQGWENPDRPLMLLEPMRFETIRPVLGNYATHRPLRFVAIFLGLTLLSASVAILILLMTRRD
ncbi:cellulose biosynthesis cyclic di-GMP-binding regulatory protein BcsB [Rhodovulum adriaticum]|uniref:Cyclic di-GMP-binding protein n=1 Tax=Rhodovulum adriaticum TaxID=35804 RepID=A0A4R2NLC9_RHOAD|nr:cellulose biosynthesis cyclic di-GMP-binding regulatory protein BcsB [Rhodovulum adriaticum]MBK1636002.1 hypothetical protein [Rhodovulum adriaticum]TCP22433.1 cellulose synthase subunit [Rhodovulum adriaticum]